MKKIGKLLFSSTLLLSLFACSPKKSDNIVKNKRTQDKQQFKKITMGYFPKSKVDIDVTTLDLPEYPEGYNNKEWKQICIWEFHGYSGWYYDKDIDSDGVSDYRVVYYLPEDAFIYPDEDYEAEINVFKFEPIEWDVLEEKDGKAIIITNNIIDYKPSTSYYYGSTAKYDSSDIRKWLNDDFYNTAFSNSEKEKITISHVSNGRDETCISDTQTSVTSCDDTDDKVYLLSYKEAITYYKNETSRQAHETDYAKNFTIPASDGEIYLNYWRLRSSGWNFFNPATVMDLGYITNELFREDNCGIRPVMCIDLNN